MIHEQLFWKDFSTDSWKSTHKDDDNHPNQTNWSIIGHTVKVFCPLEKREDSFEFIPRQTPYPYLPGRRCHQVFIRK